MAEFAQVATNEDIAAIADAIRYAEGSEDDMTIPAMPAKIRALKKTLIEKTITQDGEYLPASDDADGYSKVVVSIGGGKVYLHNFNLTYSNTKTPVTLFSSKATPYTQNELKAMFTGKQLRLNTLNNPSGSTTSYTFYVTGGSSSYPARWAAVSIGNLGTSGMATYGVDSIDNYTVIEMTE